jgi:hypothetical protein
MCLELANAGNLKLLKLQDLKIRKARSAKGATEFMMQAQPHATPASVRGRRPAVRARMSARLWEQHRIVRHYLHRWPSQARHGPVAGQGA